MRRRAWAELHEGGKGEGAPSSSRLFCDRVGTLKMATISQPVSIGASTASGTVIQVEDVHKYYDLGETRVHALRGVTIHIERGEFVAIMGSSGSGKSTFMNIVGCLDKPSGGRYILEGVAVSELGKKELAAIRNRKIGFVFQGFNLLSRTTALENVELPTLYAQISKEEGRKRAVQALELVGLGDRMEHFPSQLSGGQQQRVAIARGLVNKPAILLADEPTGNLDSRTSVEVMEILQNLNAQGLTVVLVTHEPDIAAFAKRNIHFRDGKIRRDEPVKDRPAAAEVLKNMPTLED
jgi:putative ABC transport system ATP-binding protein